MSYIRTSAPNTFSGAAMTTPTNFVDNVISFAPIPKIVVDTELPEPPPVKIVSMESASAAPVESAAEAATEDDLPFSDEANAASNPEAPAAAVVAPMDTEEGDDENIIENIDEDEDDGTPHALGFDIYGEGYPMAYPALANAITIIPVGAGLAAEKGLIAEDLPLYMEDGILPEAEINNAFDDSVPALSFR